MAGAVLGTVQQQQQQQQNSTNINGHIQNQLTRSLEKILDEANQSGELKLSNRKLKDFPKTSSSDKYNLSDTVIADLSKNRFSELPEEVTTFHFLERLQCYHNTIRYIPDAIVNLQCLIYLDLSRNQLTSLPRELCQLPIKILLVSNNNLAYLPDELSRMSQLTELDASCNQLTHLPPRMGDLKSLQSLVLRQNLLLAVPLEVTYLKLARLDLRANRIGSLPIELRDMHTLIDLLVEDNPLTSPPASLCRRGRVHIFKYLENEAIKLDRRMGVGNGGTLSRRSRKTGNNGSNSSSPGPTPLLADRLKHKRQNVDSGYSTSSDGFEKRWSQEITTGDNEKNNWTSTPNSSVRSESTTNGGILSNGISSATPSSTTSPAPSAGETPADEDLDRMDGGSPRDYNNSSYRLSPCIDSSGLTNGNDSEDKTKPLHQIQTYREYKEALKQQRAQDVPSIYRTKEDHELLNSGGNNHTAKTEPNTPTHQYHYHQNHNSHRQHSNIITNSSNNNSSSYNNGHNHDNQHRQHTSLATSKSDPTPLNAVLNAALSGGGGASCHSNKYGGVFDGANDGPPSPKKIERTSPFRNISGYSPSHATYNGTSTTTADNTSTSTASKNNHVLSSSPKYILNHQHQHQDYVKPQSPVKGLNKTSTNTTPGMMMMSHDNVPVCSTLNGSVLGKLSSSPRSAGGNGTGGTSNEVLSSTRNGIGGVIKQQGSTLSSSSSGQGRSISWNKDVNASSVGSAGGGQHQHPPGMDKMTFTMRREIDKAKEENELINQLRNIIESRLKMTLPEDLAPALTDGVVLCHLANHIKPRSVASIHVPSPAVPKLTMARCRRNVDNFIEACRRIGVDENLVCCAADVLEGRGLVQVAITVTELLRFHSPRSPLHTTSTSTSSALSTVV